MTSLLVDLTFFYDKIYRDDLLTHLKGDNMPSKWNPDPIVLALIEKDVKEFTSKITFGGRILTLQDVMEHIKNGTTFGRSYYLAFEENLKLSSSSTIQ